MRSRRLMSGSWLSFDSGVWPLLLIFLFGIAGLAPRARHFLPVLLVSLFLTQPRYMYCHREFRLLRRVTFFHQLKKVTKKSRHYAWRPCKKTQGVPLMCARYHAVKKLAKKTLKQFSQKTHDTGHTSMAWLM